MGRSLFRNEMSSVVLFDEETVESLPDLPWFAGSTVQHSF